MTTFIVLLLFAPACIAIVLCFCFMFLWIRSRHKAPTEIQLFVGLLGPLALLSPPLMAKDSERHFQRFLAAAVFFVCYLAVLMIVFSRD